MVRGQAKGYGYDKRSAALSDAASKRLAAVTSIRGTAEASFWEGLANSDNGKVWDHELETHGFKIAQVC